MTRLRVLVSAFSCHPYAGSGLGGGEDVLGWRLVKQISRFHDAWVLTYAKNRPSLERALSEQPDENLRFCYLDLPGPLRPLLKIQGGHQTYYYLWQVRAYLTALRLHKRVHFELFHHVTYANDWMASFIGALLNVPYIRGPGGGAHRTPKGFEKEYPIGGRLWEWVRNGGQWLFRRDPFFILGQSRARAIMVCNSEAWAAVPSKWSHKVYLFPVNGVTTEDLLQTAPSRKRGDNFQVLTAGTLIRVKGFGLAIKAFQEFQSKCANACFSIVGSGPEEPRLRRLVAKAQLQAKVQFKGTLPRDELLSAMAASDVFLFPSLRDGGGAVVVEAMAAGAPVICLDTGGPGMHVTEKCGVKVTAASAANAVHELSGALERLYLDDGLRQKMGVAARERAAQVYHWDRLGDRLMEIYLQGLGDKSH